MKCGVDQCIGDTLGPGGVFRAARHIWALMEIAEDMRELCPNALLLNYANPMAMCCWALGTVPRLFHDREHGSPIGVPSLFPKKPNCLGSVLRRAVFRRRDGSLLYLLSRLGGEVRSHGSAFHRNDRTSTPQRRIRLPYIGSEGDGRSLSLKRECTKRFGKLAEAYS